MTTQTSKTLVMLVDDDDVILRSLRVALSRYFQVETANSAAKGLSAIRARKPQVIVLDIKMPDHDGFWLYREIRKFDANVPIIFNSAFQDTLSTDDVFSSLKPFGYLPKSGNLGDFVSLVTAAAKSTENSKEAKAAKA